MLKWQHWFPCCYTFCQPFVTVHSDSSLVSVACEATLDVSLWQCTHVSSRIMQLIIQYWQLSLYPTWSWETYRVLILFTKANRVCTIPLPGTSEVFCYYSVTFVYFLLITFCSCTLKGRQTFPSKIPCIANANFCIVNFDCLKIILYFLKF